MPAIIKEAHYVMSNVENNNNKYWKAFLYDDGTFETNWGRVGESPNKTIKNNFNEYKFDSKCREKEKKGYKKIELLNNNTTSSSSVITNSKLEEIAKKQISHNNPLVEKLITKLSQTNIHNILNSGTKLNYNEMTGLFSTPIGIVTQDTINKARDILTSISQYMINNQTNTESYRSLFENYLMYIPQDVGRKKLSPELVFPDISAVQNQESILQSLEASIKNVLNNVKVAGTKDNDDLPQIFNMKLELVEDGKIIDSITKKFLSSINYRHQSNRFRPKIVYSVNIESMYNNFENMGKKIGNIMSLWHGTPTANCLSILRSGLQISPPRSAAITGKLYGNGIYMSDQSTKSLNYATGSWGNTARNNNPYMFLVDAAMGKYYIPRNAYDGPFPKNGYDSVFAQAGKSGVYNNEMIVYNNYQCNLTHLIEFSDK